MGKSKCNGWIGKLFGHKFKSFLVESQAPSPEQIKESFTENNYALPFYREEVLEQLRSQKYVVLCKRCGCGTDSEGKPVPPEIITDHPDVTPYLRG